MGVITNRRPQEHLGKDDYHSRDCSAVQMAPESESLSYRRKMAIMAEGVQTVLQLRWRLRKDGYCSLDCSAV